MTAPTDTDIVGTVRRGDPRQPGTVWVKAGHNLWMLMGGSRSGCLTVPSARIVASEHPFIGMVPGLTVAVPVADQIAAAAAVAAERFAGGAA